MTSAESGQRRWSRDDARDPGTLRRQLIVLSAVVSALAALVMTLMVSAFADRAAQQAVSQVLDDRSDAVVGAVQSASVDRRLLVPPAVLDPGVVVYDSRGRSVGGVTPPSLAGDYALLSRSTKTVTRTLGEVHQLRAQPFTTASGITGVVVLSETLTPFERRERLALITSVVAGVVLVLFAAGVAAWASKRALAPVGELARTAEAWSEHDLEQRFDLGPPTNEIRALASTLDGLLDKVARALKAEQRLTSELAHELRTPLTAALGTVDLIAARTDLDAQLREDVEDIQRACREMSSTVSTLLDLARGLSSAPGGMSAGSCSLGEAVARLRAAQPGADTWHVHVDPDLTCAVPLEVAVRAIAPVLDNAHRVGSLITVIGSVDDAHATLTISDDGPGVEPTMRDELFEPGRSGAGGSGLGLSLARRVARSAGGDVLLRDAGGSGRGASFEIRLPH